MIFYSLPWDSRQNVGVYYNAFMKLLPSDDDVACFLDGDATFTTTKYGLQLEAVLQRYPKCRLFVGRTNRVKCAWQVIPHVDLKNNDVEYHRTVGQDLAEKHWDACIPVDPKPSHLMSGVLFLVKKSLWKKTGGFSESGMLGVDNAFHRKCLELGEEILLMQGLYVYHWYRNNLDDVSHLVRPAWEMGAAVYTCITGTYDDLKEPAVMTPGWDYVCFTDNPKLKSSTWKIRRIEPSGDPVRAARRVKCLSHEYMKQYPFTVWVDGKLQIKCDLNDLMQRYHDSAVPMALFRHPDRSCIYQEAEACKTLRKDDPAVIDQHIARLRADGYPADNGLVETSLLIRNNWDGSVRQLCEAWWKEIQRGSRRDQLSFNYVAWKQGFRFKEIDMGIVGTWLEKSAHTGTAPLIPPSEPAARTPQAAKPTDQDSLEIDVIVPQFNGAQDTIRCLRSIKTHAPKGTRVILVDDGSWEGELKMAAAELTGFPHLVVRSSANLGFIHAVNIGLGAARAPFVVLQNNDTEIFSGCYERMRRILIDEPSAGIVGVVGSREERTWQSVEKLAQLYPEVSQILGGANAGDHASLAARFVGADLPPAVVERMVAFFCVMLSRKVIDTTGLLSIEYGPGLYDDDDYCARIRKQGLKILLARNVYVYHGCGKTFNAIYNRDDYYALMEHNRAIFERRCRDRGLSIPPRPDEPAAPQGPLQIFTGLKAAVGVFIEGDNTDAQVRLVDSLFKNIPASIPVSVWARAISKPADALLAKTPWHVRRVQADVPKHQAMRVLLEDYKRNPAIEWLVWFDEHAHVTALDWWSRVEEFIRSRLPENICYLGPPRAWQYRNGTWDEVKRGRWYRGKGPEWLPIGQPGTRFIDESYFWLRADLLRSLDWPDDRIGRSGQLGGVAAGALLGEAIRQAGHAPHDYPYGVTLT